MAAEAAAAWRVSAPTGTTLRDAWPAEGLEAVDRCLLCGSGERTTLYRGLTDTVCFCAPGSWTLQRCGGCGTAYLDPRPTAETIGQAYATYHTHGEEAEPPPPRSIAGRLRRALRNGYLNARYDFDLKPALALGRWTFGLLPSLRYRHDRAVRHLRLPGRGGRLLDVGCGNGAFVRSAIGWGWNAEGLDPDPDVAAVGSELGTRIATGTLSDTIYPDACFAAVTMDHTIEHLHTPMAALREVLRILRHGGTVWIATPNLDSIGHGLFRQNWRGLEPPRHLVLFTARALRAALAEAGFEQIEQRRGPFVSRWWFTMCHRIARGEDPLAATGSPLPPRLRLRAAVADWQSFLRPSRGEELIFTARRPGAS